MRPTWFPSLLVITSLCLTGVGCVSRSDFESAVIDLSVSQAEHGAAAGREALVRHRLAELEAEVRAQQATIAADNAELEARQARIDALEGQVAAAMQSLDATHLQVAELSARFERLRALEEANARRNAIYRQFVERFREMIDAGQLTVRIERGRIVIDMPQDILFDSGSADLGDVGSVALRQVAAVLSDFDDRQFQVEGHTDNVPIRTSRFPSNWELSTARALSVVHLLVGAGLSPTNLSAAGFGEFRPRAGNETDAGRALNRRIEIVLVPDLGELAGELP
jgi:chemotaxis protein MotB